MEVRALAIGRKKDDEREAERSGLESIDRGGGGTALTTTGLTESTIQRNRNVKAYNRSHRSKKSEKLLSHRVTTETCRWPRTVHTKKQGNPYVCIVSEELIYSENSYHIKF
jgi:hypothetical protein